MERGEERNVTQFDRPWQTVVMFDWMTGLVEGMGILGIALLMFLENVFPPIPSELIMPLAGFSASQGEMSLWLAIVAGSIGSLAGAVFWYVVGRLVGIERLKRWTGNHGRWLAITPEEIDRASGWFQRHGGMAVLLGRLVPAVRTFISVPAGMACMPLGRFLVYSSIGTVLWTAFLTLAGYLLGSQYEALSGWLNPLSNVVVGLLLLWYLYRVATFGKRP